MLVARAEWFIESFLTEPLTLEGIAEHCRASPFHLTRAFTARRGMPVMRYVWRRRLSSAALELASTERSVLVIALDAGYASHEAFTRAFKSEFNLTPSQVRAQRTTAGLRLTTRPLETTPMPRILSKPVIGTFPERSFVGPSASYDLQTRAEIPAQWATYNREGEQVKKRSRLEAAHRPSDEERLARAGARAEFGPCFVSVGWDDATEPRLVTLVVTRRLGLDELLPHTVLIDRTCLGVKNAMLSAPMTGDELEELVEKIGLPHGGMEECELLLAQSLIFNAVGRADSNCRPRLSSGASLPPR